MPSIGVQSRLAVRELFANTLFVSALLGALVGVHTDRAKEFAPTLKPFDLFLYVFLGLLIVWEALGLALGSSLNPVVSLCLFLAGDLPFASFLTVVPAQFIAHALAVGLVRRAMGEYWADALYLFAPPSPRNGLPFEKAVAFEACATAVLCIVSVSLHHIIPTAPILRTGIIISVVIGLTSGGSEYTGACMNPAMHAALAFFDGRWDMHSVYWIGPLVGACVVAGLHNLIFGRNHPRKGVTFAEEDESHAKAE